MKYLVKETTQHSLRFLRNSRQETEKVEKLHVLFNKILRL